MMCVTCARSIQDNAQMRDAILWYLCHLHQLFCRAEQLAGESQVEMKTLQKAAAQRPYQPGISNSHIL